VNIDGHDYQLFKDYDTGKFKYLTFEGKIAYLAARVDKILIGPCREAMKTSGNDLGLVLATAVCAGISAASTFYNGRRANPGDDKKLFTDFVMCYMQLPHQKPEPRMSWVEWLYRDVRCGLAHSFTIMNGGIEYEVSPAYTEIKNYGPEIEPRELLRDFAEGWSKYLSDVKRDGPVQGLGAKFAVRFDQIFYD